MGFAVKTSVKAVGAAKAKSVDKEILKHLTDLKKISHNPVSALLAKTLAAKQEVKRKLDS